MQKNQPYISHTSPLQWAVIIVVCIVLSNVVHWWVNRYINANLMQAETSLSKTISQLSDENTGLLEQNQQLSSQVSKQTQMLAVKEATEKQLTAELEKLQQENISLSKELQFYQNITQGNTSSKLQVREVQLRATDTANQFYYRLVITQGKKISQAMTGKVILSLTDDQQQSKLINEHQLNLRYVQVIEGSLNLTDAKVPKALSVTIKQGKKELSSSTFPWEVVPND